MEEKNSRIDDLFQITKDSWFWAAPILYFYLSVIGMGQAYFRYAAFGINIFEFSKLSDFLLAVFRDTWSLLIIVVYVAYFLIYRSAGYNPLNPVKMLKKFPVPARLCELMEKPLINTIFSNIAFIIVISFTIVVPLVVNEGYNDNWKDKYLSNSERMFRVVFKGFDNNENNTGMNSELFLLGTTEQYLFFLDKGKMETLAAPRNSILLIKRKESSIIPNWISDFGELYSYSIQQIFGKTTDTPSYKKSGRRAFRQSNSYPRTSFSDTTQQNIFTDKTFINTTQQEGSLRTHTSNESQAKSGEQDK